MGSPAAVDAIQATEMARLVTENNALRQSIPQAAGTDAAAQLAAAGEGAQIKAAAAESTRLRFELVALQGRMKELEATLKQRDVAAEVKRMEVEEAGISGGGGACEAPVSSQVLPISTSFQPHFNLISTPFQPHFDPISTPFRPHFNPISTSFQPHFNPI